jgi:uncharacterized membrane protein YuzA (DUF378 family)
MNVETPQGAGLLEVIVWTTVAVSAINWGLVGLMDTNLLAEFLEPELLRASYVVIGAAGAIDLVDVWTTESILGGR